MLKSELKLLWDKKVQIDKDFTELKIQLHNVDKMGLNVTDIEKQINNLGIELYKTKMMIDDKIKEVL